MSAYLLGAAFKADMGTQSRKLVLLKLIDACDEDGTRIYPAVSTVARAAQCSTRQVQREIVSFLSAGLLLLVRQGGKGPKSTTEYAMDLEVFREISRLGWDSYLASKGASGTADGAETVENKGDTVSPLDKKGDIGDTLRVTPETAKGDSRSHTTPPYPSTNPSEREGAREASEEDLEHLTKRYKALEIGRKGNSWPGVLSSSSGWGLRQFINLTPEERRLAEDRRDAYLAACPKIQSGERKGQPHAVPIGAYLRDKKFLDVEAISPVGVDRRRTSAMISVAPFGPVWAAMRALALVDGPVEIDIPDNLRDMVRQVYETYRRSSAARAQAYLQGIDVTADGDGNLTFPVDFEAAEYRRRLVTMGYPEANRLHKLASSRERDTAPAHYAVLSEFCEAIPVETDAFEAWRNHHGAMGWPFLPDTGTMKVVWFPKGGPAGLVDFERAARAALEEGRRGNDDAA
ncbi:helix-turn-helix domain-containing protein [Rhizobium sp. L51/94]|uniref:helix-turn-helix domain-containing protein n=1 Tax=Rhizobium sp. L51/94 TaxID=2819999 RepID=UPI001C5AF2A1|nr:helix-turn-helix domain-containing protein [Rhizobium sp. L51/94]QXZ79645.1 helix-turn-helix domain-containing protein [Rhizobium sp. L51/94]